MIDMDESRQLLEQAKEIQLSIQRMQEKLKDKPETEEQAALNEVNKNLIREMQRMEKNLRNLAQLGERLKTGEDEGGKQNGNF